MNNIKNTASQNEDESKGEEWVDFEPPVGDLAAKSTYTERPIFDSTLALEQLEVLLGRWRHVQRSTKK
ncbi:hypothetical protein ACSFBX_22265 [Variovorax sp. RB2P76]|uniref:hypothetical protein n=1 Tax=Variovorax sp. RB2P76 TaxID=3443736 RepID=UPI003F4551C4